MDLLYCVSQQENNVPYRFPGTGIQVYSMEEVLYHVYNYWKQSVDDITSPALPQWVGHTLGLSFISSKIKEIARIELFSERMSAFLRVIDYFSEDELTAVAVDFIKWEKRLEWETHKERADDLVNRGDPGKAILLYRRALQFDENIYIYNNLAVAYMQTEAYDDACRSFEQAMKHVPDAAFNKRSLLLNYCEALIYNKDFKKSAEIIAELATEISADVLFLHGELSAGTGDINSAVEYYEQAIELSRKNENSAGVEVYVFRLADTYASRRQYEKAIETLLQLKQTNTSCLMKMAEMHCLANNLPGAISSVKKAIIIKPGNADLWVRLARYHRLNYDLPKAEEAIIKALTLDAGNERAKMESARIKKNLGHIKAYQGLLKDILEGFKNRYMEMN